mmetsp:Transcript_13595/g.28714  ORF Transcript_13595/g.28714 Transcript_13595/m.28714 type:complete len:234 (-) Transcript_13595:83-784(-)
MDVSIADFIHSNSLAFALAHDTKFIAMLKAARHVPSTYVLPSIKDVGGSLLVENYKDYINSTTKKLHIGAELFGLTAMKDGATIVKCPLTNILVDMFYYLNNFTNSFVINNLSYLFLISRGYEFHALMDVVDSTEHMANGGVKDAEYLTKQFIPVMQKIDPQYELFDMVAFDGAANVQKGGRAIAARFPRVIIIQGAGHVCSLFLAKTFKEPKLQLLKTFTVIVSFFIFFCFV